MQSISKLGLQNLRLNYQKEITYKRIISIVKDIYDDVIKTAKETLVTSYTRRLYDQYDIYNIDDSAYEFHKEHIDEIIKDNHQFYSCVAVDYKSIFQAIII